MYNMNSCWQILYEASYVELDAHFCLNVLPQSKQLNGFSPLWIILCLFSSWVRRKSFTTLRATKWFLSCMNPHMWKIFLNLLPHSEQLNSFSPVWLLICTVRLPFMLNLFPHSEQLNGFSPVWILICTVRLPFLLNLLPHSEHTKCFLSCMTPHMYS